MFHLLWDIYLCFDQITKNIWNTKTHICGGKTWGREIINAPSEDIGDFSPYMGAVGIETYDGEM